LQKLETDGIIGKKKPWVAEATGNTVAYSKMSNGEDESIAGGNRCPRGSERIRKLAKEKKHRGKSAEKKSGEAREDGTRMEVTTSNSFGKLETDGEKRVKTRFRARTLPRNPEVQEKSQAVSRERQGSGKTISELEGPTARAVRGFPRTELLLAEGEGVNLEPAQNVLGAEGRRKE